jgi:IS5 family transposase
MDLLLMLKIHFLQQWYNLSDPGMEEAIYDRNSFQKFLDIDLLADDVPDETTILNFRHFLEEHKIPEKLFEVTNIVLEQNGLIMKKGTTVDATIITASGSTKNNAHKRDPEMKSTKKGANYHFGMKAHTGTDMESGVVHTLKVTSANESDVVQLEDLLHGEEKAIGGDKAYASDKKKKECRELGIAYTILDKAKKGKKLSSKQKKRNKKYSSIRALVEHPYQVIKHQWGHRKVRYKGLFKNTMQFFTLFMLANIFKVRRKLAVL